ncbi:MAG TPA: glycoside hydrolase family 16 protein [Microbacteriaceae bacterium]|nr:glycoside hydrolase family 16 protein [Microbacteriaceae bacterium]
MDTAMMKKPRVTRRMRLAVFGMALGALVLGGLSPAAPASASTSGLSASGFKASVHGAKVTVKVKVSSAKTRKAVRAGICARSSTHRNVDFSASRNVNITPHGTTFTKVKTFAPGRYTYAACAEFGHTWKTSDWKHTFTVKKVAKSASVAVKPASAATVIVASAAAAASSTAMPVGDLPGWHQVLAQNFTRDTALGDFPGPYTGQWMSYNGFGDTSGIGLYDQSIISSHNDELDLYVHTADGRPLGAAPIPLVDGQWGGQRYGMFSVRMKADALAGYGAAFLLWPDSNNWNQGEIDFPEGALNGTVSAFNHCPGHPQDTCLAAATKTNFTAWHTYTIEWTPTKLSFLIDGKVIRSTTKNIPQGVMHWVGQVGTNGVKPAASVKGHVFIDWMTIYTYRP